VTEAKVKDSLVDREGGPLVRMRFRPAWAYIEGIREFGRFFCETTFEEPELAERARLIIQEALENAVKYSIPGPRSELEFSISSDGKDLEISVCSTPAPEHLDMLRRELATLNASAPEAAYLAAFERASESNDARARLGLARIRYEGAMNLSLTEENGGRVRVTARGAL